MKFDPLDPPEVIHYNGVDYRRMGGKRKYYLSQSKSNKGRKNPKGLHVAIWEHESGLKVQKDQEINHKDRDTFNFEYTNLECVPKDTHRRMSKRFDMDKQLKHLDDIRHLASDWHRSPAGRQWHRKNAIASLEKARIAKIHTPFRTGGICEWCGSSFKFKNRRKILCSTKCQSEMYAYRFKGAKKAHSHYLFNHTA